MRLFCIIVSVRQDKAGLCKGSTADSDSVCEGSNPSPAARMKTLDAVGCKPTASSVLLTFLPIYMALPTDFAKNMFQTLRRRFAGCNDHQSGVFCFRGKGSLVGTITSDTGIFCSAGQRTSILQRSVEKGKRVDTLFCLEILRFARLLAFQRHPHTAAHGLARLRHCFNGLR